MPDITRGVLVKKLGLADSTKEGLLNPADHTAFGQNGKLTIEDDDVDNSVLLKSSTAGANDITIKTETGLSIETDYDQQSILIENTAPDQTVTLTAGAGITITGTYPNFTISLT